MTEYDDNTHTHLVLKPDMKINHYRLINKIGAGGMGEVYLAEDTKLDRQVALKFLPYHLAEKSELKNRFVREAKATAKLNHPHVVTIYEVGEHDDRIFFAMEYVNGKSLKSVIKEDSLVLDKAVNLGVQLCEGLQEAHNAGIVHRDIKPANIVIEKSGRPKILDFGLATITGVDQITKTGSTLGTIGYMSPEQIRGQASDHRSDLFSFGVVFYELLTGCRPFDKDTEAGILNAIINEKNEPLSKYKSGIPDELERIIDKLLDKSPELRYQSASGVISDLKRLDITGQLRPSTEVNIQSDRKMMVVLPFENLGPVDDEYFADGITEEIISRLAVVKKLGVISRTSAMKYKGSDRTISEIGRELNVDYVLEGTVRWSKGKDHSRVRITPQLIKVLDDTHLWADRYDRTLEDIFDVQSDIAEKVIDQLNVTLLEPEKEILHAKPTENMDAYNAFLRAKDFLNQPAYMKKNMEFAIQMYEHAIKLDPEFVQAYALLSTTHTSMFFFGHDTTTKRIEMAQEILEKAKSLDSSVAEVYLADAFFNYHINREYGKAIKSAEIAAKTLPIEPNRILFAIYRRQGKFDKALEKIKFILSLNPNSVDFIIELGITYAVMNEFDKGEKYLLKAESLAPDQTNSYGHLMFLYIRRDGNADKFKEVVERMPNKEEEEVTISYLYAKEYERGLENLLKHNSPDVDQQPIYLPGKLREAMIRKAMNEEVAGKDYLISAIKIIEERIKESPKDYRLYVTLGSAYALNKERDQALKQAEIFKELLPLKKDLMLAPSLYLQLAELYAHLEDFDQACNVIEQLFENNTYVTPGWIKAYWGFNNMREYPRYKELMEKYDRA